VVFQIVVVFHCRARLRENSMACDEAQAGKRESTAGRRRQRARPRGLPKWYSERSSPSQTKQDRRRIKELERDLQRKNMALAETTALLVLSKKLEAIFQKGEDE